MRVLSLIGCVAAYGKVGHWLSGKIASSFLTPEGQKLVQELLPKPLETEATWADEIKSRPGYRWASPLHYLDPEDDFPPNKCTYDPKSDQGYGFNVVGGIFNYTRQILDVQNSLPKRQEALRFLIHFVGDIHQPLHLTGRDRGGNNALVKFQGRSVSMHGLWDSIMFEKRIRDQFPKWDDYAASLVNRINGDWSKELGEWLTCPSTAFLQVQSENLSLESDVSFLCPQKWARYSNLVNCVNVWPAYKRRYEMSGKYYEANILVAEKMLAQAGYRMAYLINEIAAQSK
ncbi:S1/P1 nuclease [Gorgonomyces haynaldii]|nr:S1/P1 nuclease [Gorgonomyces haynaldii]